MVHPAVILLAASIACTVLTLSNGQCVTDGTSCMMETLNMLTDGISVLRDIKPNMYYTIAVGLLQIPNSPSGAFLQRIAEFVDTLDLGVYYESMLQVPAATDLKELNMYDAKPLRQIVIGKTVPLTALTILGCGISQIPPTIENARLLEKFSINGCVIRNFTFDAFKSNPNLKLLDLSQNEIDTVLPSKVVGREVQLAVEYLGLSSNNIENLDMTAFASLSYMLGLDLSNNKLTRLVAERTVTWPALTNLMLAFNLLPTIDLQWLVAPTLNALELGANQLTSIPLRLRRFPALKSIDLSRNNFSGFDLAPLNGLPELSIINLSSNPAARYIRTSRPLQLPKLYSLDAVRCALMRFNSTGMDFPSIKLIALSDNNFSTVPPLGQAFPGMDSFYMNNNPLTCAVIKARSEAILSDKLSVGAWQDPKYCSSGYVTLRNSKTLCCVA